RYGAEGLVGNPHLADDLSDGQVAVEALLAGRAGTAIQRAARLGGYTEGAPPVLRNVHGFHAAAGRDTHHPLAGAVPGDVLTDHLGTANFGAGLELFPQG